MTYMKTIEEINKIYDEILPLGITFDEADEIISSLDIEYIDEIRERFCNELLDAIFNFCYNDFISLFCKNAALLPESKKYFKAVLALFENRDEDCLRYVRESFEQCFDNVSVLNPEKLITEEKIVCWYLQVFYNNIPGFWNKIVELVPQYAHQPGVLELCKMIKEFYGCQNNEDAIRVSAEYVRSLPSSVLAKELLACAYYDNGMWNNAIAYFEAIEDECMYAPAWLVKFYLGYAYGKIKDIKKEEQYYRKSIELFDEVPMVLNNLGYCLYKRKNFLEARSFLERCLEIEPDHPNAQNNYPLVLLALGRNKDAKIFLKKATKVSAAIKRKVEAADDTNARLSKKNNVVEIIDDEREQESIQNRNSLICAKAHQFSSEKLLEDELTSRIESGTEVFGMNLKMYKRKGAYGRQFIIPVGRLDLLCEDDKGNLYIIELKKDSGYSDAYEQTAMYLDWFEKNKFAEGKKVYGIICLNSPTEDLLEKVHKDKRMRLFEYHVSYTER